MKRGLRLLDGDNDPPAPFVCGLISSLYFSSEKTKQHKSARAAPAFREWHLPFIDELKRGESFLPCRFDPDRSEPRSEIWRYFAKPINNAGQHLFYLGLNVLG